MSRTRRFFFVGLILLLVALLAVLFGYVSSHYTSAIEQFTAIDRPARLSPDYTDLVVPPNIAPLNFLILEDGIFYCATISSASGQTIEVFSKSPEIIIPQKPWSRLLTANRGKELHIDIFAKADDGRWNRFQTLTNTVANEEIDDYLVYRKIMPAHGRWGDIGIRQRNLTNYDEATVLDNSSFRDGCLNCHSFWNNRPDKMTIGIRSPLYGSSVLLIEDGEAQKIGTKFGYTAWHPSGKVIAYSINEVYQYFHSSRSEVREVIDEDSMLAYYLLDSETAKTTPEISRKDRLETYPTWSPDGKYLYYSSARMPKENTDLGPPRDYNEIKYDLMRISYDLASDEWGSAETILPTEQTGRSHTLARISPDGRWLLFCMSDYGSFPVYAPSSDLYMIDLKAVEENGRYEYKRLPINSDKSESWHSWSSNSRWIVFSSKRLHGVFTRTYISHIDEDGNAGKPILLPQKDPTFYDSHLRTFSVPELIIEPIPSTKEQLGRVVRNSPDILVDAVTRETEKAGTAIAPNPYGERE
jgi:hypothetical protein